MEDQITCFWFNNLLVGTWWWKRQNYKFSLWFQLQLGSRKIWQNCFNYHLQHLWFDWLMNNSFTYNKKRKEWPQQQKIWSSFKITKTKWENVTCVFTCFCDFKVFVTILTDIFGVFHKLDVFGKFTRMIMQMIKQKTKA